MSSQHDADVGSTYITGEIGITTGNNIKSGELLYKCPGSAQKATRTNRVLVKVLEAGTPIGTCRLIGVSPYAHAKGTASAYDSWRCLAVCVQGPCRLNIPFDPNEASSVTIGDIVYVTTDNTIHIFQNSIGQDLAIHRIIGTVLDIPRDRNHPYLVYISIVPK